MAETKKKKRKGRRAYLNDFYTDVSGNIVYTGVMYRYEGEKPFRQSYLRVALLCGAVFAAVFAIACVPAPSMLGYGKPYVVLPFIFEAIGVLLTLWAAIRLGINGPDLRAYVWEATAKKLPWWLEMTVVFACVGVIGNIVYLAIFGFEGKVFLGILVIVLHIAAAVSALLAIRALRRMTWCGGEEEKHLSQPED